MKLYGYFIGSDNFISNFIIHLVIHWITKESHKKKMNEVWNNSQMSQPRIDEMIWNNLNIKSNRNWKFVEILIKNNWLINICNDKRFIKFIHEFDLNY